MGADAASAMQPQEIDRLRSVLPADVGDLMPAWDDIPDEFKRWHGTKWNDLFSDWFYRGVTELRLTPKPGIDQATALRHIKTVMGSWEPKHEHKEAAVAYLLSLWFEDDAKWTPVKPVKP